MFDIDHRVPLHKGGTNDLNNLQALCPLCHAVKTRSEASERAQSAKEPEVEDGRYFRGVIPKGSSLCGDCGQFFSKNDVHSRVCPIKRGDPLDSSGADRRNISFLNRTSIAATQRWKCAGCSGPLPPEFVLDHKVPPCKGGTDDLDNMKAVCQNCHSSNRKRSRKAMEDEEDEDEGFFFHGIIPRTYCICGDCEKAFSKYFTHYHYCKPEKM